VGIVLAALALSLAAPAYPAQVPDPEIQVPSSDPNRANGSDPVVARVEDEPIHSSEIDRLIELGLAPVADDESVAIDSRREVLDLLIGDRLRGRELRELGLDAAPDIDPAAALSTLRRDLPGLAAVLSRVERANLPPETLARVLGRQAMVVAYVEERLGSDVFVRSEEIEEFYRTRIEAVHERRGTTPPELEEVRDAIRAELRESRLLDELDRWTSELVRGAEIEILLDSGAAQGRGSGGG
jgi:hypothetical protein